MEKDTINNLEKWKPRSTVVEYLSVSRKTVQQWKFEISEIDEWIRSGAATDNTYTGGQEDE